MGWLPYSIRDDGAQLVVDWCNLADRHLAEPFFDQSIYHLLRHNPQALRATSVEALADFNSKKSARRPAGFIFHMSRCGSTLITQMLAAIRQFVVFSEPVILETVLRGMYQPDASNEQKQWLLKNVIQAFAGYKTDGQSAFIKFSARAIFDYPMVVQTHPSVPCIFVYREPVEVLVSLASNQTGQLPPGLDKAGLLSKKPEEIKRMRPMEFWARVIANQCAAALEMFSDSQPLLINYSQLPEVVWTDIVGFFGSALSAEDVARMQEVLTRSAKAPQKRFSDDRAKKREVATEEMLVLVDRFVRPYYNRLESIRTAAERLQPPMRFPLNMIM